MRSGWRRWLLRGLSAWRRSAGAVRSSLLGLIAAVVVAALVWTVVVLAARPDASDTTTGLGALVQGQAVNALSVVLFGAIAYGWFLLNLARAKARYLERYRPGAGAARHPALQPVFVTIVEQLLGVKPPRSSVVIGDPHAGGQVTSHLPAVIADHGLVPIVVDVSHCAPGSDLATLSREAFLVHLVRSTGDEQRARRFFRRAADRRQLAVVVVGLDRVAEGRSLTARRAAVEALLRTAVDADIPFVASVSAELAPSISDVTVLRVDVGPSTRVQAVELSQLLRRRGAEPGTGFELAAQRILDAAGARLAPGDQELLVDLLLARARTGEPWTDALEELCRPVDDLRRTIAWLRERIVGRRGQAAVEGSSGVELAVAALGIDAHHRQEPVVEWSAVTRDVDREEVRRLASGVATLQRRRVVTVADGGALSFASSDWLSFAGAFGMGLDERRWSELLRPGVSQATLRALTFALVEAQDRGEPVPRSFVAVLDRLTRGCAAGTALDIIVAVVVGLQRSPAPLELGRRELDALRSAWRASTDPVRSSFVSEVSAHPAVAGFLWEQVAPDFATNSFRLRRSVCARLAAMGPTSWTELAGTWQELVGAARTADLSSRSRSLKPDWRRWGLPLASLAWILPSLAERLVGDDRRAALELLRATRSTVTCGAGGVGETCGPAPDIGLEISLAEGFKYASVVQLRGGEAASDEWWHESSALLSEAVSWRSEQVLLQALALSDVGAGRTHDPAASGRAGALAHPFAAETAALVARGVGRSGSEARREQVLADVWLDDVDALEDGGISLSGEAHRLLALSTLLINLAEGALARHHGGERAGSAPPLDGVAARDRAFQAEGLPRCFRSASHTAAMFAVPCDCEFELCGPEVEVQVGHRRISRAFTQRAEVTSRCRPVIGGRPFVRRPFAAVWRDERLVGDADQ